VALAALLAAYVVGVVRLDRRASQRRRVRRLLHAAGFAAGVLLVAAALSPPVDRLADTSVAAHMAQHLVLLVAAPPLLVWSEPLAALATALPRRLRPALGASAAVFTSRRIGIAAMVVATELHVGLMVGWHAPPLYDAAASGEAIHALEHASFLLSGLLFWSCVLRLARRGAGGCAVALAATIAASVQSALLGILLTLSTAPWYATDGRPAFGLTPVADQQAAGAEMWVVAGGVYVVAAGILAAGIVRSGEPRAVAPPARTEPIGVSGAGIAERR
jgi:cytochrome c oxidase assembly factor CtaG